MGLLSLIARLTLNASSFEAGLKRTSSVTKRWGSELAGGLKGQLGAAFGTAVLAAGAKNILDYGGKLSDLAATAKTSTRTLQEFEYAVSQNGGTLEDVAKAFGKLREAKQNALGGDQELMNIFKTLGISEADLQNNPVDKLFADIAETIRNTDFGDDEEPLLRRIMGKGASNLIPAFKAGISELREEFNALGLGIDDNIVSALDRAGDKMDALGIRLKGAFAPIVADLATSVGWLFDKFEKGARVIGAISATIFAPKGTTRAQNHQLMMKEFREFAGTATSKAKTEAPSAESKKAVNPELEKKAQQAAIKEAEKQVKLVEQLQSLREKGELAGLSTEEKRLKLLERMERHEKTIALLKAEYGNETAGQLSILQEQIEKETVRQEIAAMEPDKGKGSEFAFDPLTRIGGLSINSDTGMAVRTWQDKMLKATEQTARNTNQSLTPAGLP